MLTTGFDPSLASGFVQSQPDAALNPSHKASRDPAAVDRAAKDFESMFLSQMLEQMFADVHLGGDSEGEQGTNDIYRSMLVGEYGKLMTQAGGIGVADYVKREMLRAQEVGA